MGSFKKVFCIYIMTSIVGVTLHFLYFGTPLTAWVAPVNESIWEHTKLLYWPYLLAMALCMPKVKWVHRAPWLLGLMIGIGIMLSVGYYYHIIYQGTWFIFDIILYFITLGLSFALPYLFLWLYKFPLIEEVMFLLALTLGVMIILFSFFPPSSLLFQDLSTIRTWLQISI